MPRKINKCTPRKHKYDLIFDGTYKDTEVEDTARWDEFFMLLGYVGEIDVQHCLQCGSVGYMRHPESGYMNYRSPKYDFLRNASPKDVREHQHKWSVISAYTGLWRDGYWPPQEEETRCHENGVIEWCKVCGLLRFWSRFQRELLYQYPKYLKRYRDPSHVTVEEARKRKSVKITLADLRNRSHGSGEQRCTAGSAHSAEQ